MDFWIRTGGDTTVAKPMPWIEELDSTGGRYSPPLFSPRLLFFWKGGGGGRGFFGAL